MLAVGEPAQQYGNRSHQAECIPLGRYPAYGSEMDPEGQDKSAEFCNASIRRGFMRKVYLILLVQLVTSLVFIVGFNYDKEVRQNYPNHFAKKIIKQTKKANLLIVVRQKLSTLKTGKGGA